jgi:hypothetical protein
MSILRSLAAYSCKDNYKSGVTKFGIDKVFRAIEECVCVPLEATLRPNRFLLLIYNIVQNFTCSTRACAVLHNKTNVKFIILSSITVTLNKNKGDTRTRTLAVYQFHFITWWMSRR